MVVALPPHAAHVAGGRCVNSGRPPGPSAMHPERDSSESSTFILSPYPGSEREGRTRVARGALGFGCRGELPGAASRGTAARVRDGAIDAL